MGRVVVAWSKGSGSSLALHGFRRGVLGPFPPPPSQLVGVWCGFAGLEGVEVGPCWWAVLFVTAASVFRCSVGSGVPVVGEVCAAWGGFLRGFIASPTWLCPPPAGVGCPWAGLGGCVLARGFPSPSLGCAPSWWWGGSCYGAFWRVGEGGLKNGVRVAGCFCRPSAPSFLWGLAFHGYACVAVCIACFLLVWF